MTKQKLELTWIGKGEQEKIEPRILLHDSTKDYGDTNTENMLIHGDNLLALKALEQQFAGKVKCIYIDPPYNINVANPHYNDNKHHSDYISLMKYRLEIIQSLLSNDGTLWVSINADELFYLKIICDEIFGETNFITIVTLKTATTASYRSINVCPVNVSEFILVYAKDAHAAKFRSIYVPVEYSEDYGSVIIDMDKPIEQWKLQKLDDIVYEQACVSNWREFRAKYGSAWKELRKAMKRDIAMQMADRVVSLNTLQKPAAKVAALIERSNTNRDRFFIYERENNDPIIIYNGRTLAFFSSKLREIDNVITPSDILTNIWTDISYLSLGLEGGVKFANSKKPEKLIQRVLTLATNPGDLVLDSFLGSGTTAAVAHKMGRRWIGIELGEHCYTHCKPRLDRVIDGTDNGGITKAVNWQGGGGYKFYELAPTLIVKDKHGLPIFSEQYDAEMLTAAVAKINGFVYAPNSEVYWQQGYSQDKSYIYITTNYFTADMLDDIAADMDAFDKLLVCAPAFDAGLNQRYDNISVRKIPDSVLQKCRFGRDNYNLNIVNPPELDEEDWEDMDND